MTRSKLFASVLTLTFALAATAGAARADADKDAKRNQELEEKFKAADKDNDGKLTLAEAKAGMPRIAKGFAKIDTEKKGYLTLEQIKTFAANR